MSANIRNSFAVKWHFPALFYHQTFVKGIGGIGGGLS